MPTDMNLTKNLVTVLSRNRPHKVYKMTVALIRCHLVTGSGETESVPARHQDTVPDHKVQEEKVIARIYSM